MKFKDIVNKYKILVYRKDISKQRCDYTKLPFIGVSLHMKDQHNITRLIHLKDNTVDIVQYEDLLLYIEYII